MDSMARRTSVLTVSSALEIPRAANRCRNDRYSWTVRVVARGETPQFRRSTNCLLRVDLICVDLASLCIRVLRDRDLVGFRSMLDLWRPLVC